MLFLLKETRAWERYELRVAEALGRQSYSNQRETRREDQLKQRCKRNRQADGPLQANRPGRNSVGRAALGSLPG